MKWEESQKLKHLYPNLCWEFGPETKSVMNVTTVRCCCALAPLSPASCSPAAVIVLCSGQACSIPAHRADEQDMTKESSLVLVTHAQNVPH